MTILFKSRPFITMLAATATAGTAAVLGVAACSDDVGGASPASVIDAPKNEETFIERELAASPNLRVRLGNTVFLDLEGADQTATEDTGNPGEDVVPYTVGEGESIDVCLGEKRDGLAAIELVRADGKSVLSLAAGAPNRCASASLEPGDYDLHVKHDASTGVDAVKSVFLHAGAPLQANGSCSADSRRIDPGDFPDSVWHIVDPGSESLPRPRGRISANGRGPVVVEAYKNQEADPSRGLQFAAGAPPRVIHRAGDPSLVLGNENGLLSLRPVADSRATWHLIGRPSPWSFFVLDDSPDSAGVLSFYLPTAVDGAGVGAINATNAANRPLFPVTFAARRVPADRVGELKVGEVALFDTCNFGGTAWVINDSNASGPVLALPGLAGGPKSIKVGCETYLRTWSGPIPINTQEVQSDVACNPTNSFENVQVKRRSSVVVDVESCASCSFRNKDLSGKNLSRVQFINADFTDAKLVNANATGASFLYSNLTRVDFTGAMLDGMTGSGIPKVLATGSIWRGASCRACELGTFDFTNADLSGAVFDAASLSSCVFDRTNLDGTSFAAAAFRSTALLNIDLRNVKFGGPPNFLPYPGENLSERPCDEAPPNLRVPRLSGSTFRPSQIPPAFWRRANLDGAIIDATGDDPAATAIDNADLCGLRASGTTFRGVSFRNTRFDRSLLVRASFVNLDLRDSSFKDAIGSGATFIYSDLGGIDLTDFIGDAYADDVGGGAFLSTNFKGTTFAPKSMLRARLRRAFFREATVRLPAPAARALLELDDAVFVGADLSGSNMTNLTARGGDFSSATFLGVDLTGADLSSSQTQHSDFSSATFCGATFGGTKMDDARSLSGALLPIAPTDVVDRATKTTTPCSPVKLGGAPTREAAISTARVPICPNDRAPTSSAGCAGADFNVDSTVSGSRLVCPGPDDAGVAPTRLRACRACASDCDCASLLCAGGKCSYCAAGGT
jgi:uncharacterized protein YjbI with pentapeptide repeats